MSGLDGSAGQMANGPFASACGAAAGLLVVFEAADTGCSTATFRSGTTAATLGSWASAAACALVTLAENALPSAKCLTFFGAAPVSLLRIASWLLVALARRED